MKDLVDTYKTLNKLYWQLRMEDYPKPVCLCIKRSMDYISSQLDDCFKDNNTPESDSNGQEIAFYLGGILQSITDYISEIRKNRYIHNVDDLIPFDQRNLQLAQKALHRYRVSTNFKWEHGGKRYERDGQ